MKIYDTTLTAAELETPLHKLPSDFFETCGKITGLTKAAGYDESAKHVVNQMEAWGMTAREFRALMIGFNLNSKGI